MRRQCAMVMTHLQVKGSITPNEAESLYRIKRLAARVCELRECGYPIYGVIEAGRNAHGDPVRYARYSMKEKTRNEEKKC